MPSIEELQQQATFTVGNHLDADRNYRRRYGVIVLQRDVSLFASAITGTTLYVDNGFHAMGKAMGEGDVDWVLEIVDRYLRTLEALEQAGCRIVDVAITTSGVDNGLIYAITYRAPESIFT
jgi:hypothetical protein